MGRFTQEDSAMDGLNWYVYGNNNPVLYADPSGNFAIPAIAIVGIAVAAAAVAVYAVASNPVAMQSMEVGFNTFSDTFSTQFDKNLNKAKDVVSTVKKAGMIAVATAIAAPTIAERIEDQKNVTHQTYTKTNPVTGEVYSGRTSGKGTPADNVLARDANHHMNALGFGPARLELSSKNYFAIRGHEQYLIHTFGGAKSEGGTSGNAINGISRMNPLRKSYISAMEGTFGLKWNKAWDQKNVKGK